jgi:hypothetical protein
MYLTLLARALEALEWSSAALTRSPPRAEDVARVSEDVAREIRKEVSAELRRRGGGAAECDELQREEVAVTAYGAEEMARELDRFAEELEERTRAVRGARRGERA